VGDHLIAWTVRGVVCCFLVRFLLSFRRRGSLAGWAEIAVWAAGWLLLAAHTICAFHFEHGWSHAAAYAHTARRTLETAGWDWGGGLYLNYLTVALWGLEVLVLVRARRRRVALPRWWTWLVMGWIGFIIVNATIVFGPRWWWAAGLLVAMVMIIQRWSARRSPADQHE
jgi:hypothetical protein